MRILGLSNPHYSGVTIATKAITTNWMAAPAMTSPYEWQRLSSEIFHFGPQVLVVGGWSQGYLDLLKDIKRSGHKDFPILSVCHSTPFHGSYFHKDWQEPEYEIAFKTGLIDLMGFVHPQTAEYYQKIKKTFAVWVPHAFPPARVLPDPQPVFRIGILGGDPWYKNFEGSMLIAKEFAAKRKNVEISVSPTYSRPQEVFLALLGSCSALIHLSHLECYSNTVQEAWARGIPVILSPANNGLTHKNPLLDENEKRFFARLQLSSSIEPVELYQMLEWVEEYKDLYSEDLHESYTSLYRKTQTYLEQLFLRLVKDYPNREHDVGFFEAPFTKEGLQWNEHTLLP